MNPQFQLMFEQALHAFQGGYVDRADSLLTKIISLPHPFGTLQPGHSFALITFGFSIFLTKYF